MTNNEILNPGVSIRPKLSLEDVKTLMEKLYGLYCKSIFELDGYDDKNYKITVENVPDSDDDSEYVLKILNSFDSKKVDFIKAQDELLLYLCNNNISCPHPIENTEGKHYSLETLESGKHIVRLMKFIPGTVLFKVPHISSTLISEIGTFVATLDKVLEKFNHPAYASHKSLWMLNSVPHLRDFISAVDDESRRKMVEDVIVEFEEDVLSKLESLEKGMIHGDFNEQNILIENIGNEWKMKSILDFGDSQYSCYLFELAIAMLYVIISKKDVDVGAYFMRGYEKIRKIPEEELDLLKICIEARLCQSLVMGAYSNKQDPKNVYILTTSKAGWEILHKMRSIRKEDLLNTWKLLASQ